MSAQAFGGPLGIRDVFGLRPLVPALRDGWFALAGNPYSPPSQWGLSSVKIFKPWIGLPTWLGHRRRDRRVPVYNFFNRVPQPRDEGYSVRVTYCRDWRGGRFTYDGHLGTDFAVPVGTPVAAAAPGIVLRTEAPGEQVARGRVVGLAGASGMEFLLMFPWVAPHVHYNVWLNGEPVDPFAREGEVSFWRQRNDPRPFDGTPAPGDEDVAPSDWDPQGVEAAIDACRDPAVRQRARALVALDRRAAEILLLRNYRKCILRGLPPLCRTPGARRPCLDLPFRAADFVGAALP